MFGLEDFLREKLGLARPQQKQTSPVKARQTLMQVNPDGSHGPSNQGHLPPAQQKDTWLQPTAKPFKMYEDRSFQGDPRQFASSRPGFKFYEDNTFSAPGRIPGIPESPAQQLRQKLQMTQRPQFQRFEDGAMTWDGRNVPAYDSVDDFTTPRY